MANRDFGIWFLPILAALAFYYPSASGKQAPPTSNEIPNAAQASGAATAPLQASNDSAQRLIRAYSGNRSGAGVLVPSSTADFIIATVPDPLDSSLSHLFDRHVGALQRAMEAADYVLDRFELPWLQTEDRKEKSTIDTASFVVKDSRDSLVVTSRAEEQKAGTGGSLRLHQREPGVLLFRSTQQLGKLFVFFLVGESPTAGIHKDAFKVALRQGETLCDAQENSATCHQQFRFLAPTFSGSVDSLVNAFKTWKQKRSVKIASGSATSIKPDQFEARLHKEASITASFKPSLVLDHNTFKAFDDFLTKKGIDRRDVAILTESNTGFGGELRKNVRQNVEDKHKTHQILSLTYPLHISQLRTASEKARAATKNGSVETPQIKPGNLRLSLEEATKAKDVITNFSPFETFSTELLLSNLLATISREGIRYVGLFSTDIRDQIFLAREIRKHAPHTVFFTFGADLLYVHTDVNLDFEGMLLFSTYPLFSMNQDWTLSPERRGRSRLQFPNDSSQGVYNAMLDLLGREEMKLEDGFPFKKRSRGPALWLSAVGKKDFWPIEIVDDNKNNDNDKNNDDRSAISEAAGIHLPGSPVILAFVGVPCFILFLRRLVPSIEGTFFYLFFGLSFLIVYMALSFTFLRFLSVWWRTRNLLRYLSSRSISAIYAEIAKNGEMPTMDLSHNFTPYSALRFSYHLANDCLRFGEVNDREDFSKLQCRPGRKEIGNTR